MPSLPVVLSVGEQGAEGVRGVFRLRGFSEAELGGCDGDSGCEVG